MVSTSEQNVTVTSSLVPTGPILTTISLTFVWKHKSDPKVAHFSATLKIRVQILEIMEIELLTKLGLSQNEWRQESYEKHLCCQHLPWQHNGSSFQTWAPLIYLMSDAQYLQAYNVTLNHMLKNLIPYQKSCRFSNFF